MGEALVENKKAPKVVCITQAMGTYLIRLWWSKQADEKKIHTKNAQVDRKVANGERLMRNMMVAQ